jgi:hypothetical protein
VLKSAGEPGSHHVLGRQQRQDGEEDDAAPGEDAKRGREYISAHRLWLSRVTELARAGLGIWGRDRPRWPANVLNTRNQIRGNAPPSMRCGSRISGRTTSSKSISPPATTSRY